jgi:large subunit ribosomal protein L5
MRFLEHYKKIAVPALREAFGYRNLHAVPRVEKVTINVGVGRVSRDKAYLDNVVTTLRIISGQQPVLTKARKSIASFKVREGMIVGVTVTLRGQRMYDFLDKLIHVTLPRVRDFRGLSPKQMDAHGNLSIGFRENIAFPEIRADEIEKIHGLEVCITTSAQQRAEGLQLLTLMGMPFQKA